MIIALGIAIGVAFERIETSWLAKRIGVDRTRDLLLLVLVLRLVVSDRQGSALVLFSPQFRASFDAAQETVRDEAARVAAMPGEIFCSNKVVCRAAGKPFAVDEFKMEELVATGKASKADIAALLEQRHIGVFVSDRKTMASSVDTSVFRIWRNR